MNQRGYDDTYIIWDLKPFGIFENLLEKMNNFFLNSMQSFQSRLRNFPDDITPLTNTGYESENFPLAYSLVVHSDAPQIARLISAIYSEENIYCIHVDKSSPSDFFRKIEKMAEKFENIFLVTKRVDVLYAHFSRVQDMASTQSSKIAKNKLFCLYRE